MNRRNNRVRDNADAVREYVLSVCGHLRQFGYTTLGALHRIAEHCGVPSRRTRTIAFEDQTYKATDEERRHMAFSIADLLDQIADEAEERARKCRYEADGIRCRERQQQLVPLGMDLWGHSGSSRRNLAA